MLCIFPIFLTLVARPRCKTFFFSCSTCVENKLLLQKDKGDVVTLGGDCPLTSGWLTVPLVTNRSRLRITRPEPEGQRQTCLGLCVSRLKGPVPLWLLLCFLKGCIFNPLCSAVFMEAPSGFSSTPERGAQSCFSRVLATAQEVRCPLFAQFLLHIPAFLFKTVLVFVDGQR